MTHSSFVQYSVHRINIDAPRIFARIRILTCDARRLSKDGKRKTIIPRDLMALCDKIRGEAIHLQHELTRLAELREGVRRSQLGTSYDAFASGHSGSVSRIGHEFEKLDAAIHNLAKTASDQFYGEVAPGDAAAELPVTEVIRTLLSLLDFWNRLGIPKKLA